MRKSEMHCAAARCAVLFAMAGCLFSAAGISRMEYPDADTVTIDDSTRIEYRSDGTFTVENDERILALTEKGRRSLRTVSLHVSRRYGDAEIVKVEIIGADGVARAVDFKKTMKETTENSSTSANIYDPLNRVIKCAVSGMEVGEVRRVVTRQRMTRPRMRDAFAWSGILEDMQPIMRSSIEIVEPVDRPIASIKLRHPAGDTVARSPDSVLPDGRRVLRWTAENVPQAFPEPDMPPFSSVAQKLLVSTSESWEEVSRWYWNLCLPHLEATNAAMAKKVGEITEGIASGNGRIRALFKFVSQEVRYMGLTMEEESPGYAPHDVRITFDNRYGVCRDKAALLVSMLRMAGIEAYPVLICVGPKMDEDVPIPYFNHAIVAVAEPSGGYMLMDPTNENTKDILPAYLMNCSYLVAHPEGRPLATVPVKPAGENILSVETSGSLEPDGSAIVKTAAEFRGVNDLYRGGFSRMTPKERRRKFEAAVKRVYQGAELLSFEMTPLDLRDTDATLAVSFTARLPDLVVRGSTRDELTPPFAFAGFGIADYLLSGGTELEKRRYPLTFFSTAKTEERLELRLGDSVGGVLEMPPDVVTGTNGCRYVRRMEVKDGVLRAVRSRTVDTVELSPEEYLDLKTDLKTVEMGTRRKPQFAARGADKEANVRTVFSRTDVHMRTPFSWTATNSWEKEVLTYAGKKSSAELKYSFNQAVGSRTVVSATASNRNGRVHAVTPAEMNVLDADWAASAPRYSASKTLVVNLPAVETGSVIRVIEVLDVTNSPVAYCGMVAFDSTDPIGVKEVSIEGVPVKVAWGRDPGRVIETDRFSFAVTNPPALPREPGQPSSFMWRNCAMVSAADLDGSRESLLSALAAARRAGCDAAREKAVSLAAGAAGPEEKIRAVRDWLYRNVRLAGPGLFSLPFERAFFPPDRSLEDGYASAADWMNLYFAMLEALGFDVEFVLSAGDALTYPALARARREVPQPDDFGDLLIRATVREGGWFFGLFGSGRREFILDYENDYVPLGVRDIDGMDGRTERCMSIDLNETGAARISVSNSTWGVGVGDLRKKYAEMLPEMRSRHHTELVGDISESAEAISGLCTDTEGYPFVLTHSVYAPDYAAKNGDALTLVVPGIGGSFLPGAESGRKSPFGVGRRLGRSAYVTEVLFPEGYSEVEYAPDPWEISLPGDTGARCRFTVDRSMVDGRLRFVFREEHLPGAAMVYPCDWSGFFRDWNRRTGSNLARTVVVRKPRQKR